jgi:O-antigen polymerase
MTHFINYKMYCRTLYINEKLLWGIFSVCAAIFIFLPSVSAGWLMNGFQSGKTFVFIYLMLVIGTLTVIRSYLNILKSIKLTILDLLLLAWVMYTLLNGYAHGLPLTLRFLDFCGLVIFYIALRQLPQIFLYWLSAAFIFGGALQAVYGTLQIWGYVPSKQSVFNVTGSFFNPGPFHGYLASVFICTLGFYIFKVRLPSLKGWHLYTSNFISNKEGIQHPVIQTIESVKDSVIPTKGLSVCILSAVILVLSVSVSRACLLAILFSLMYLMLLKYGKAIWLIGQKVNITWKKKLVATILILIVIISLGGKLYTLNKASANGRRLIWAISLNMIKDRPVFGAGFDRFKAHYMNYQAKYFKKNTDAVKMQLAGDTNYAFNELLQEVIENGLLGSVIFIWILIVLLKKEKGTIAFQRTTDPLFYISKAGVISIIIFSLFSYPAQILPIKTGLVLFMVIIGRLQYKEELTISFIFSKLKLPLFNRNLSWSFLIVLYSWLFFITTSYMNDYVLAYANWKTADESYQLGDYNLSLKHYGEAHRVLKRDGDLLTAYGKALSVAGKYREAIVLLTQGEKLYPNTILYMALGDSYMAQGSFIQAESAYQHSSYMVPGRFYPQYLLSKLYEKCGAYSKAVIIAHEIMKKPVKIKSTAITEIKEEMRGMIEKYSISK